MIFRICLAQNPLHFSFPPEVDEESLMLGAEQLSQAVLESGTWQTTSHNRNIPLTVSGNRLGSGTTQSRLGCTTRRT